MRILLINQTFYPELLATSQQVTDLALFLTNKGHSVSVFTGRRGYEERRRIFPKKEVWKGVTIERVHSTGLGKTSIFRRVFDSFTFDLLLFLKLLQTPKFDLVVSFTSPPLVGFLGALFCSVKGGRAVQWLMDVNPDAAFEVGYINRRGWIGRLLNFAFEWTLKYSHEVVVLDQWMRDRIFLHGVPQDRITIVPPWSVIKREEGAGRSKRGLFREINQLESKFVLLYSGNHSVVHPLRTVLDAALELRQQEDIVFVFAGSGLRTQDVSMFKNEHALKNIVQLPWQTREALEDSFRSIDLHLVVMGQKMSGLVHTSKIYSVMASGRPYLFVGPEKSHVADLLNQCAGGMHVRHGDVPELVRKVLWFKALNESQKADMGQKNVEFLKSHFGLGLSLTKFEQDVVLRKIPFPSQLISKKHSLQDSP